MNNWKNQTIQGLAIYMTSALATVVVKTKFQFCNFHTFNKYLNFLALSVTQTLANDDTSGSTTSSFGPAELLVDVPFDLGCFQVLNWTAVTSAATVTSLSTVTPASCLVGCVALSKRFAGTWIPLTLLRQWLLPSPHYLDNKKLWVQIPLKSGPIFVLLHHSSAIHKASYAWAPILARPKNNKSDI